MCLHVLSYRNSLRSRRSACPAIAEHLHEFISPRTKKILPLESYRQSRNSCYAHAQCETCNATCNSENENSENVPMALGFPKHKAIDIMEGSILATSCRLVSTPEGLTDAKAATSPRPIHVTSQRFLESGLCNGSIYICLKRDTVSEYR